jgi:filamentous hemagglutinin family protein
MRAGSSRRLNLLQGVSLTALLLTSSEATAAAPFRSINQALSAAKSAIAAAAGTTPQAGISAARTAKLGATNLAAAATRFRSLADSLAGIAAQNAAVPNGLAPGGLQFLSGTGASAPAQAVGTYNVTVTQTQQLAQLSWQTFNIGAHTKLTFNQSAGGTLASSWVVINTISDPAENPSTILGAISAPGKVYVLNRNGVIFGAGSTINVGGLVAATADIAQSQFSTDANGEKQFTLYGAQNGSTYLPTFVNGGTAGITVAAGADISTPAATGSDRGGAVMLLGGNVINDGLISTPQGQTILAAGTQFTLRQGSEGSTNAGNTTSTTLGSEIAALNTPSGTGSVTAASFSSGAVTNNGIVVADQGDITLAGEAITQSGVLLSTTTVDTRGTIHLLTPTAASDPGTSSASIVLAPQSVTEILPEDNGATALDSQRAADVAASVVLDAQRVTQGSASAASPQLANHDTPPDQFGESRIEISSGGSVDFAPGAVALTPGGQVAVAGAKSILVESGATIDVSGSTDAVLPASVNDLLVNVQPYQLRDSAANRTGGLKSTNVYVDARTLVEIASGAYGPTAANPLGNIYTPGGLFEVGGYLGLVAHGINEWTAIGGQVTLQTAQASGTGTAAVAGGSVVTQPGSVINLTGGIVTYEAGPVQQTYVVTSTGLIYNANAAPGNLTYTGIYTGETFNENRWGIHQTFINPLLTPPTIIDPTYVVGRDAGTLTVSAGSSVLQGTIDAGVTLGQNQTGARPAVVSDPYLLAQSVVPLAGSLLIGNYVTGTLLGGITSDVAFSSNAATAAAAGTLSIDAGLIAQSGLAQLSVTTTGDIQIAAPLQLADGGTLTLNGVAIEAGASITARGGSITLSNINPVTGQPLASTASSLSLASGATLDARGLWTNARLGTGTLAPSALAGEALVNGGSVTLRGVGGVDLAQGSRIDVSSGGALLANNTLVNGAGGNITVVADVDPTAGASLGTAPAVFDASLTGFGGKGGGTLSLSAPGMVIGDTAVSGLPDTTVQLATSTLSTGFARYVLDGTAGLTVLPGTQLVVAMPVYVAANTAAVPTGGDPSSAYTVTLPQLFIPVRGADTATQRGGASITLLSDTAPGTITGLGGTITIASGVSVTVDPGQSIVVDARGQVTILGALVAHAGTVEVADSRSDALSTSTEPVTSNYVPGLSVWLGAQSLIDVSGQANLFTDALGRSFGSVSAGGTIELGGYGGLANANSTWAQVIERPGAILDANGAHATVGVVAGETVGGLNAVNAPVALASNGGTIIARSLSGIALDGTMTARAGGAGAAGGALYLSIDPINLAAFDNIAATLTQPSEIEISQSTQMVQPAGLQPGEVTPDSTFGLGAISEAQIAQGGFGQLNLFGADFINFVGNVALTAGSSITLTGGAIGDSLVGSQVSVAAPHVVIGGYTGDLATPPSLDSTALPMQPSSFSVQADLLDFEDAINLGGRVSIGAPALPDGTVQPNVIARVGGFRDADFSGAGDVRFLGQTGTVAAKVASQGNITFRTAQIYPISFESTTVIAGVDTNPADSALNALAGGTLAVLGLGGAAPQAPYAIGGSLALVAGTVLQDGIVRAPQGSLRLGWSINDNLLLGGIGNNTVTTTGSVTLGAGGITSVSMIGQTIPFGGTVDGVNYLYPANTGSSVGLLQSSLEVDGQSLDVAAGATVDLRGGGTLSGAGFVVGRGGSADVLRTPLLNLTGSAAVALGLAQTAAIQPAGSSDPVYAILPGYASDYAPIGRAGDADYSTPATGEQITVGAGEVTGLAAGTYTLLPAYYALLPGGYRVELTKGTVQADTSIALGNFSVAAPVVTSIANTGVGGQPPSAAIFTSGTNVRQLSQYDEESFNSFEAATGTQFGAPRPALPQDAKTLVLNFTAPAKPVTGTALSFAPTSLLDAPDSTEGGYGLTVEITSQSGIDVLGSTGRDSHDDVALSAAVLSALDIPRLVLGGTITIPPSLPNEAQVTGIAPSVTIAAGADLSAGDVMITTSSAGTIAIAKHATVDTIGAGSSAYDLAQGFYFTDGSFNPTPILDVSNGQDVFLPPNGTASGVITVADKASLLAGGSLDFIAPAGTSVTIGNADLGGKYVSIAVANINIGKITAALKDALPGGLDLSVQTLDTLLAGNAATGVPSASQLTLTATSEVNILGSVSLDTANTALVLNTPAIYGYGSRNDAATITAPSFTWSGVTTEAASQLTGEAAVSAPPGGQIAGSAGHVTGSLTIDAGTITLGDGPQTQPKADLSVARVLDGFSNVSFNATKEITANDQSSLTVFARQTTYGEPGKGGNLTFAAPLITTEAAAVLSVTAGGSLTLSSTAPASTGSVTALGGEIDLTASSIAIDTAIALPAGRLSLTAQSDIVFGAATHIDLAGRRTALFDQTANSNGGTLLAESTSGNITQASGAVIDVSSPAANAGAASFSALAGTVALDGTLDGSALLAANSGSFSVIADTLTNFDPLNATLDAGGFFGARAFEIATGDITIDGTVRAKNISVAADSGSIDLTGTLDASGTGPGTITLAAGENLTLAAGARIDAHATTTAVDSYGDPIDAENRAQVTLTAASGVLALQGGAIDVSYPGDNTADVLHPGGNPQGQVVFNVPRLDASGNAGTDAGRTYGDIGLLVTATPDIIGAGSIALYANTTYKPTDPNGTVEQGGKGETVTPGAVTIERIGNDNTKFMTAFASLGAGKLGGLTAYGSLFHVRPGVIIQSSAKTGGDLTISGDLDFSGLRTQSGAGYGTAQTSVIGSGEPGSITFRAANQLIVNGSISDGFAPPPDSKAKNYISADTGWVFVSDQYASSPLAADIILPSSLTVTTKDRGKTTIAHQVMLGAGTTFDTTRAISLNYDIVIQPAAINARAAIPFAVKLGAKSTAIPAGGWVATAAITDKTGAVLYAKGALIPAGTILARGDVLGAGSMLPFQVQTANNADVPAGTPLDIFAGPLTLNKNTALLPVNALLPANTVPIFLDADKNPINKLELRPVETIDGNKVQGYIYPLAAMLPAGSLSWDMSLVAGANLHAANTASLLPKSVLNGGALAQPANTANQAAGSLILDDQHDFAPTNSAQTDSPAFSVIRTGTGNLTLEAGGDFDQSSLYGIYTAGSQTSLGSAAADTPYQTARNDAGGSKKAVLPGSSAKIAVYNQIIASTYQAYYPNDGGNVFLRAQGNLTGDILGVDSSGSSRALPSDAVGNWLWRQGGAGLGQLGAWWINFGTLAETNATVPSVQLTGFQGIGALGGGNVTVIAGGNAGDSTDRAGQTGVQRGEGIIVAIGGTGRVLADGTLVATGGGNETVQIGGTLNPLDATGGSGDALNGDFIDLRGNISITAGQIGTIQTLYTTAGGNANDPRSLDPFTPDDNTSQNIVTSLGGPNVLPGDATVDIGTMRDLVLGGAGDPGRVQEQSYTFVPNSALDGVRTDHKPTTGGDTGFSLWTSDTSISLFSAGGNVTPTTQPISQLDLSGTLDLNDNATDFRFVYPANLYVTAATGNIVYGAPDNLTNPGESLETAPSAHGEVSFLAGTSIYANAFPVDMSGASTSLLSTPFDPAYTLTTDTRVQTVVTDIRASGGTEQSPLALFALEADTPSGDLHANDPVPARFYAAGGDIVNLISGETITYAVGNGEALSQWVLAAKPVRILASNDIVSSGTRPDVAEQGIQQNQANLPQYLQGATASGDVFLNMNAQSISVVSAGRDILSGYFYVGGPGLLEVDAGRNLFQGAYEAASTQVLDFGAIRSLGSLIAGSPANAGGGASLAVLAGIAGATDYSAFANLYFNTANQADLGLLLTDPANAGKVQQVYATQLAAWLAANYPTLSQSNGALAAFDTLPPTAQAIFIRDVFFLELLASGEQYNDATSRFFGSYQRGELAIDTLFPSAAGTKNPLGVPAGYNGSITMLSGPVNGLTSGDTTLTYDGGIATEQGGSIQVLDPGGQVVLGTAGGPAPGAGSGIIGNGTGDIDIYAKNSVLLGKSRIFTTGGGNILVWSSQGDINAGIGARTTVVYDPPLITYDATGGQSVTAPAPTNGAGIATLQPLPGVPAGNVDLIAPVGTIDAGEAGIRVSGNLNIAAAHYANTANISVGGKTTGNTAAPTVSIGAIAAASAAAGAAANTAQTTTNQSQTNEQPSVIDVEIIGVSSAN